MNKFLSLSTAANMKSIVNLPKSQHNFDRIFGSLDCTHTYWKNCPKAWHGSFKKKDHSPLIVLETICNYHIFFGMFSMVMQKQWMTTMFWTCLHSDTTFQMKNLNKLKKSQMLSYFLLEMTIFIHYTFLLICEGH